MRHSYLAAATSESKIDGVAVPKSNLYQTSHRWDRDISRTLLYLLVQQGLSILPFYRAALLYTWELPFQYCCQTLCMKLNSLSIDRHSRHKSQTFNL
ncbi:hypothetical protein CEXT_49501 [Caerostris extrusa]|uniref:Uncharacterized protein n=1 Tax=Caerostris extrusa TaxID=172846 RepID=A0AAV4WIV7_CAEEX|nr:hypothetical protein CEXT_49501 [Caerostris extrusa]